jgi:transposase
VLNFSHQTRVFLFLEPVDMRKSFRGLCLLTESVLKEDPASGHWFAFINRRQDRMKLLGWDGQGFWIWYKRLESGGFQKPTASLNHVQAEIDVTQLSLIINGIDLSSAKRRRRYGRSARGSSKKYSKNTIVAMAL